MKLVGVLFAMVDRPVQAMQAAAERPRSWWLPATLLVLAFVVLVLVGAPYQVELANQQSAEVIERMAKDLSEQQLELMREQATITNSRYLLSALGVGLITIGLGWLLRGGIVHLSSMAMGGISSWPATFTCCLWSMIPFFVRDLLQALYVGIKHQLVLHQGLAFLAASGDWLRDSRNLLYALLSNIDPFTIWHLILLAIGIHVATRLKKGQATALAVIVWAVFLGLKLIPVAISASLAGRLGG